MSKRYGFVLCSAGLGFSIALASSCSPSSGAADPNATGKGKQGTGARSGSDASLGAGNESGSGANGGGIVFGGDASRRGGNGDGALTLDSACGTATMKPELITVDASIQENIHCTATAPEPLALYIMLDNSGSMDDNNKWKNAVAAITSFVKSDTTAHGSAWSCVNDDGGTVPPPSTLPPPGTGSISVAIQYFHPPGGGGNECDGTAHATPDVPMAPLPGNGQAIIDSLAGTNPHDNTPTTGALTGGTEYCASYQTANPGKKCVVVLVTDGQPNGCGLSDTCQLPDGGTRDNCVDPNSARVLTPIAGGAFNAANSVMTFTVGMQGITAEGFVLLNTIAQFGGSDCTPGTPGDEACNVTTGGSQAFLDALNTIRHSVQVTGTATQKYSTTRTVQTTLACEWLIPAPDPGQEFDKGHVNVKVSNAGIAGGTLGNVANESDCTAAGDGWYYDNPDKPTKIVTCPDTCTKLKTATDPNVELLVGCVTQPAIFH